MRTIGDEEIRRYGEGARAVTKQGLGYRPALDGLRAVAVMAVIVYHGKPGWLPGGWLGVDLFFVISGFLITTLLLTEHDQWGRIDLISFWAARARRLFPALAVMLLAVLLAASRWTIPARRTAVSDDVLGTMGYIANWRFLSSDEGYFAAIAVPSPLRHAWSLAVEEQFYIVFPLLLMALLAIFSSRRVTTVTLLALAGASASWMAYLYVPGVDPARVYYGTDTRAQELLIGATLAIAMSVSMTWANRIDHLARALSLPALALVLGAMFRWDESRSYVFRGGLLVFCALAVAVVVAVWSPSSNRLQRALAWEPVRRVGAMSYGLYLWHWPVMVFGTPDRVGFGGTMLFVAQVALTFALAGASLRFVEQPVRRGGFRALVPASTRISTVAVAISIPVLVAGAVALPSITSYAATTDNGSNIRVDTPPAVGNEPEISVMLMGNSVPQSTFDSFPPDKFSDISLSSNTFVGCDPFPGQRIVDGETAVPDEKCARWASQWPDTIAAVKPDLVALYVTQELLKDREVGGKRLATGSPQSAAFIMESLDAVRQQVMAAGAGGFALVDLACHQLPATSDSDEITRTNDDSAVRRLNTITRSWAEANGVSQIDQYGFLCDGGYHDTINGVPLYEDFYHLDDASGAEYWKWLGPQLRRAAGVS